MQDGYEGIKAAGANELIAISSDSQQGTASTRQNWSISYLLLSDEDIQAISGYNVKSTGNPFIARPATYIVDENGRIAERFLDGVYSRTDSDDIITALNGL